jgi:uncharacterized protein (TIGR02996 family)
VTPAEAVLANPQDDAALRVFADWLLERGDPWGEVITLQLKNDPRAEQVIAKHWSTWFGAVAQSAVSCRWERGLVQEASFETPQPRALASPVLRFVKRATLKPAGVTPEMIAAVCEQPWVAPPLELVIEGLTPALFSRPEPFQSVGEGLKLSVGDDALTAWRPRVREVFPLAWLSPVPVLPPGNCYWCGGPPAAHREPRRSAKGAAERRVQDRLQTCMRCASRETMMVFYSYDAPVDSSFTAAEYRCTECGYYTSWEYARDPW